MGDNELVVALSESAHGAVSFGQRSQVPQEMDDFGVVAGASDGKEFRDAGPFGFGTVLQFGHTLVPGALRLTFCALPGFGFLLFLKGLTALLMPLTGFRPGAALFADL
ncbi:hypothetical protein, partial [Streptomyces galilaeus]|uniref:hypothetical protein n=1 Tax=Streptomyces galilaeus TaxID=33899 RepID=UPI0038F7E408